MDQVATLEADPVDDLPHALPRTWRDIADGFSMNAGSPWALYEHNLTDDHSWVLKPWHIEQVIPGRPHPCAGWRLVGVYACFDETNAEWQRLIKQHYANVRRQSAACRRAISPRIRFRVFRRDGYRCRICGRSSEVGVRLEVDHRVAWANGGDSTEANLWALCEECNQGKGMETL